MALRAIAAAGALGVVLTFARASSADANDAADRGGDCEREFRRAQRRETDERESSARELYASCAAERCAENIRSACRSALERLDRPEPSEHAVTGPLIVGGVGAVALIVAAVLSSNASAKRADAKDVVPVEDATMAGSVRGEDLYERERLNRQADRLEAGSYVSLGVGLAAIAGAVIWYFASSSTPKMSASAGVSCIQVDF